MPAVSIAIKTTNPYSKEHFRKSRNASAFRCRKWGWIEIWLTFERANLDNLAIHWEILLDSDDIHVPVVIPRAGGVRTTDIPRRVAAPSASCRTLCNSPTSSSFTRGAVRPIAIMLYVEIRSCLVPSRTPRSKIDNGYADR